MNAPANGQACGSANGQADALFSGSVTRTVHAKRREGKGPDRTRPEEKLFGWLPRPSHLSDARELAFWAKVTITPGCWIWNASTGRQGYGQFWDGHTMRRAHVWAWWVTGHTTPTGHELDHTCHDPQECQGGPGCPHRRCVNPAHMQAVTHVENMRRRRVDTQPGTRGQRYWARQKAKKAQERLDSGWWVCI